MNKLLFKPLIGFYCPFLICLSELAGQANNLPQPNPSRPNLNAVKQPNLAVLLPKQLSALSISARTISQSWLDLAGLAKVSNPPAFPSSLTKFRQSWRAKQPHVATFLGNYRDDGQRGQIYSLSIFPSRTRDQVCIVEFSPKFDEGLPDLALPEILVVSKANYKNRQLLGSRLRTAPSMILPRVSFNGDRVEFLGILDRQNQPRIFAASGLPQIPDDLPRDAIAAVNQALKIANCIVPKLLPENK
ncbi:MAG: hypothetical protein DCE90_12055 [Pseudanabaena sp.]|nr:MAG: hypothetical protein DCE90_12055 [Pseudanabaena sp.]